MTAPKRIDSISVDTKANIYFDGKVASHSIYDQAGNKRTIGLIYPGQFRFNTDLPERMDIIAGTCRIQIEGSTDWRVIEAGSGFDVPGKSAFNIEVVNGVTEYLCTFIEE